MYLSIIIPAYNESKRIRHALVSINKYLSRQDYDYEILVVNDGSKDNTSEVVKDMIEDIKHLRLIDNKKNHGKGWVVKKGMHEAKGDIRLFMDADNSTTVDQFEKMIPKLEYGFDIVIGSRRMKGAKIAVHQPWYRDVLGGIFRLVVRTLVPLGLSDTQAGFKAFTAQSAQKIFPKQTIFRWAFDVEILAIARKLKLKIAEVPLEWRNDTESTVKFGGMVAMLFEVLQTRLNLMLGRYKK